MKRQPRDLHARNDAFRTSAKLGGIGGPLGDHAARGDIAIGAEVFHQRGADQWL